MSLRADAKCPHCGADVASLPRALGGGRILLDPIPAIGGRWVVDDRGQARTVDPRDRKVVCYAGHAQVCARRALDDRHGTCRTVGCLAVVVLYGPGAQMICDACRDRLTAWKALPAAERGSSLPSGPHPRGT